ncbi:MAG: ribbon-helix-helix domain-containing protein [Candidatus Heimdallarchaeota archaeon]|nr:ribbon-helix-helix domain-containing protein [Candidatus Heimdallarchaeota archaeon]
MKKEKNYTTISLPTNLINKIEPYLDEEGYSSIAEFVKEAIRRRLDQLNAMKSSDNY